MPKGSEPLPFTPSPLHGDATMDHLVEALSTIWSRLHLEKAVSRPSRRRAQLAVELHQRQPACAENVPSVQILLTLRYFESLGLKLSGKVSKSRIWMRGHMLHRDLPRFTGLHSA